MGADLRQGVQLTLRVLVPAALVVDAVVHLHLAHGYQDAQPGGIGEGTLFRIESVLALVSAAWVLLRGSRASFALAFLVALTAVAAAILYRYVNVPAIGPIPSMYEPIWFRQKTYSAIAETIGSVLAAAGAVLATQPRSTVRRWQPRGQRQKATS